MVIYGMGVLAMCTLAGVVLGDVLGNLIGVQANVGGVGLAMILLLVCRTLLARYGVLTPSLRLGIEFWAALYIPIVVAMAAQQNVVVAVRGGPIVLLAASITVVLCFAAVAIAGRVGSKSPSMDELEEATAAGRHAGRVAEGRPG